MAILPIEVQNLSSEKWAVVDLDSGTILGTNVRLVRAAFLDEGMSDSAAIEAARDFGRELSAVVYSD
jgi:hypothetical protein